MSTKEYSFEPGALTAICYDERTSLELRKCVIEVLGVGDVKITYRPFVKVMEAYGPAFRHYKERYAKLHWAEGALILNLYGSGDGAKKEDVSITSEVVPLKGATHKDILVFTLGMLSKIIPYDLSEYADSFYTLS